jgi:DNA-binding transcriptional regulator YbjK
MNRYKQMNKASRDKIVNAAFTMAVEDGLLSIRRNTVAERAGIAHSLVTYYFNMNELRDAIIQRAIECEQVDILAQGLALSNSVAVAAPAKLKSKALATLL